MIKNKRLLIPLGRNFSNKRAVNVASLFRTIVLTKWSTPRFLRLGVVRPVPQLLQPRMSSWFEMVSLEYREQVAVAALMERHGSAGAEHRFAAGCQLCGSERCDEACQAIEVAGLLQCLAQTRHLVGVETDRQRRQRRRRPGLMPNVVCCN